MLVSVLGIRRANYDGYYLSNRTLNLLTWSFKYSPHPYFGYDSAPIRGFERDKSTVQKTTMSLLCSADPLQQCSLIMHKSI